jgi:glyoxylase I family protein
VQVIGLDHIYVSVSSFEVSEAFYDRVMGALGFRKGDRAIAGEPHAHYFNPAMQFSIRPARPGTPAHDSYAPGLHHFCFQLRSEADVDEAHAALAAIGVTSTAPRRYPEYNDAYYATFFTDPDGLRLELICRTPQRDEIAERWDDLRSFVNPIGELHEREAGKPSATRTSSSGKGSKSS